ncbi:putative lipase atg15 [Apophysomyces sp. BC1021]|nr:putative lipase atg15 [Apophysomyces sp. BC1021]
MGETVRPSRRDVDRLHGLRASGNLVRWRSLGIDSTTFESVWGLLPDVSDHPSVLALAMMTYNSYLETDEGAEDWYDLGAPWNKNSSFGWESDGIRGHVFANPDDSLMVISFKGTSAGLFTGGPTGDKDKINDNMLFSCCCARISRAWKAVCDCYQGNEYICENSCLEENLLKTELYYDNALELYKDVSDRYPNATVWLTGHSLGGALASLVGQTFGVPTVTFESPGDRLPSQRLHMPRAPGAAHMPLWHFGHTADPIFIGVCTGAASSCWYGGFAMESRCHTGKVCVWDTVNDNGWRVDIRSHRAYDVIENIIKKPEEFPLPKCEVQKDCDDCGLWQYIDKRDGLYSLSNALDGLNSTCH